MEIKSLGKTNFKTIYKAFNQVFADYEFQLNKTQLQAMLKRRGFNPDLSFGAFNDKNEIIAFTFNGVGHFNGISTAYDTGTGTIKEHRGKGLATKIFEHSIPHLRKRNIKQYLLEALQHNTKAVSVYKNLGFEVIREFNYFTQNNDHIRIEIKNPDSTFIIKRIDIEKIGSLTDFWDFYPSWQNDFDSIKRTLNDFAFLGVHSEKRIIGYCVFEPVSGDITQIAVDKQHRRKGIATFLLNEIIKLNKNEKIKIVNTDITCKSITDFLKSKNIEVQGKQFEMIKKL